MPLVKRARGGALLTALFIMTLVAIVATAMSTRLQVDIYRTRLIDTHDKLYLASQAVTFWAFTQLDNKELKFTKSTNEGMVAQYPKNLESLVGRIKLTGGIYDMQARFNINNMGDKKLIPPFMNLLSHTVDLNNVERLNLALAVQNWLLEYDLALGKDTYTSYYLSQKPPYYPSHQLMQSVSEFRLIKDVSSSIYQAVEPFITVLPDRTPININTASKKVLMSLGNGLNESQANELIMARGENGIKDMKQIAELSKKIDFPQEQITIDSQYFLSVASATSDEFKINVYTLLKRKRDKNQKISVSVIREIISSY